MKRTHLIRHLEKQGCEFLREGSNHTVYVLRTDGVDVLTSTNPEEDALEKIYSVRPQVVLTDLVMPGMTGMELLERIVEFDLSIQVVLMTAHYSTESAVEAIRKGACDYLDKPIKVGVLRERIGSLIESARQMQRAGKLEQVRELTQRAHLALARHNWPGNVRELENVIGHACMMTASEVIDVGDLPDYLVSPSHATGPATHESPSPQSFEEHERHLIADALARSGGNQSEAARMLRIGRDALRYKIKKHNLG